MVAGVEVTNEFGTLLLRYNLQNPVLRASGNVTTETNDRTPLGASKFVITYTAASTATPLVAIRPPATSFLIVSMFSGTTWTFEYITSSPVGTSIPYWVFDAPDAATGTVGMEIYDDVSPSMSALMFSVQKQPLRIADVWADSAHAASHTYETGHTYAGVICRFAGYSQWEPGAKNPATGNREPGFYGMAIYGTGVRGITNGLASDSLKYFDDEFGTETPDYGDEQEWLPVSVLAVDVTGY